MVTALIEINAAFYRLDFSLAVASQNHDGKDKQIPTVHSYPSNN